MGGQGARSLAGALDGELVFDPTTDGLSDAFGRYAALYSAGADVETDGEDFYASVGARLLPGMAVFNRTLHGVTHRRDRGRILRDGMEHFTLHLVRSGRLRLDADGATHALGPGEAVLLDMTRPFRSAPAGRLTTVSLDRARLVDAGLEPAGLHGAALEADDGRLAALLSTIDERDGREPGEAVLQSIRARLRPESAASASSLQRRQERARAYLEAHLADPDLSPAQVAAALGLSRATLYRAFEPLGGVAEWLQMRRLQRVRMLLASTSMSVAEAGRRSGFVNASHLTFAYQLRFGRTPSGDRRARAGATPRGEGASARYALADMGAALAGVGEGRAAA